MMDRSEPINVGAVKRETKLKELWKEAKCIMARVKSSCSRAHGGGRPCSLGLHVVMAHRLGR